jgi:hypothetical protein
MISKNLRNILIVGAACLIGCGIPIALLSIQNCQLKDQNSHLVDDLIIGQKSLTDSLQRAESKIVTTQEDLSLFAEKNELDIEAIRADLHTLDATLAAVAVTEGGTTTIVKNYYKSTDSTPSDTEVPKCKEDGRPIDVWGHTQKVQSIDLEDSNGMKIAKTSFEAAKETPWSSKVYGIRYKVLNSVGRQRNGRLILHTELTAENPEAQPGETFRIKGISSEMLELPAPRTAFDWWDPFLYLIANIGVEVRPEVDLTASFALGFSIMSYGDWRFVGITAGYDAYQNNLRASLIPVLYNLGSPIPFLSDLWVFLDLGWSPVEQVSVGFGIATTI